VLNSLYFCKSVKKIALFNIISNKSNDKETFLWLNGNHHSASWCGLGVKDELIIGVQETNYLDQLQAFIDRNKGKYIFGAISFSVHTQLFKIADNRPSTDDFPLLHFFVPRSVFYRTGDQSAWELKSGNLNDLQHLLEKSNFQSFDDDSISSINWKPSITKKEYCETVEAIKEHIQQGDIYELNYCYSFEANDIKINPRNVYHNLNNLSRGSFSVFGLLGNTYIMSASPERFMQKKGAKLISQPIKGTKKRGNNEQDDRLYMHQLMTNEKERRENIMIVDLVRNDMSKLAKKGSVAVDELCAIYTFDTVHQMISTVSCELKEKISFTDILSALFPMGSMTGAPKKRALELIVEYEKNQRNLYSGSIGMIHPDGDFDWNVIIRTLFYDPATQKGSYSVGSAITYASSAEEEFEETLLKAKLLLDTFSINQSKSS
jgi:para-aminobenzoate synthetase component I